MNGIKKNIPKTKQQKPINKQLKNKASDSSRNFLAFLYSIINVWECSDEDLGPIDICLNTMPNVFSLYSKI